MTTTQKKTTPPRRVARGLLRRTLRWLAIGAASLVAGAVAIVACTDHRDPMPLPASAAASAPAAKAAADRPAANPLRNAYFGETHLHTSYSLDANLFGTRNDPRMAYRFAKGEAVAIPETGKMQKLQAPLDFAAVTDHAEGIGLYALCNAPGSPGYWSLDCLGMRYQVLLLFPRLFKANIQSGAQHAHYPAACNDDGARCRAAAPEVWRDTVAAANEAYVPGRFTSLIGFEYSPTLVDGGMIHRNVIFRNDHVPNTVFGAGDGFAEDLLRWLDARCTGDCQALSIPHNPNFSWGLMFGDRNADASPVTREQLALRARYERLVEIFQVKGSSECAAGVGGSDEECGFENLFPACTPQQLAVDARTGLHAARCVGPNDLVRTVLRRGLVEQRKWGFDPFKFGFVGGTDNHNGTPGDTNESTYMGHAGSNDSTAALRLGNATTAVSRTLGFSASRLNPGGLTGVWAEENTRESIWDAMKRRETWGTSGTRLRVRVFGGYGYPADLHRRPGLMQTSLPDGVPMGGDLPAAHTGQAPSFVVVAMRDPRSAPLQKVQIVKGWAEGGETHEQVMDIACSGGAVPDAATHRCPASGATVNVADCSTQDGGGAAQLSATWTDPDFHADRPAFWYVRVLENPTCRYSRRDANAAGLPHPADVPETIQERAWTSPIWYDPAAH